MNVRRGEIFYIQKTENIGSEQEAGRPAVIVSNEANNMYSETAKERDTMKRQPEIKGNRKYFKTLATMGEGKDRSKSRKRKKRGNKP